MWAQFRSNPVWELYHLCYDPLDDTIHVEPGAVVYVPRTMNAQTVTPSPHPEGSQSGGCGIGGGMGSLMVSFPLQAIFVAPGLGMATDACICGAPYSQSPLCRLALNEICTRPFASCAGSSDFAWQPLHTTWT